MEGMKKFWIWYRQTSMILGVPVLMIVLFIGFQKVLFTGTCQTVGWRCEYSLGATDAMAEYMGDLLASNPGTEIVAKKRKD